MFECNFFGLHLVREPEGQQGLQEDSAGSFATAISYQHIQQGFILIYTENIVQIDRKTLILKSIVQITIFIDALCHLKYGGQYFLASLPRLEAACEGYPK